MKPSEHPSRNDDVTYTDMPGVRQHFAASGRRRHCSERLSPSRLAPTSLAYSFRRCPCRPKGQAGGHCLRVRRVRAGRSGSSTALNAGPS